MARVFGNDQRGRGENLDRAMRHVSQIADGSAHQVQSPRPRGAHRPADAGLRWLRGVLLELLRQSRLAHEPDNLIDELPVLEEENRRDRAHVEFRRCFYIRVDVDLRHLGLALILDGKSIQNRSDHATWRTPGRPKIDHGKALVLLNLQLEIRISYFQRIRHCVFSKPRVTRGTSSVNFSGSEAPSSIQFNDPINPAWPPRFPHRDRGRGNRRESAVFSGCTGPARGEPRRFRWRRDSGVQRGRATGRTAGSGRSRLADRAVRGQARTGDSSHLLLSRRPGRHARALSRRRDSAHRRTAAHWRRGKADCLPAPQIDRRGAGGAVRLLSSRRSRVPAEVAHGGDIHIVDVPAAARTPDRIERRCPNEVALLQLDADLSMCALPRPFAEDPITVVVEVAGENDLALLQLSPVHCFPGRTVVRSKDGGHRLEIAHFDGAEKLVNSQLGAGSPSKLTAGGSPLGCTRTGGEKKQAGKYSEGHDRILHEIRAATYGR